MWMLEAEEHATDGKTAALWKIPVPYCNVINSSLVCVSVTSQTPRFKLFVIPYLTKP